MWMGSEMKRAAFVTAGLVRRALAALLVLAGLALMATAFWNYPGRPGAERPVVQRTAEVASEREPRPDHSVVLPGVTSQLSAVPDGAIAVLSIPSIGIKDAPIFDRGTDAHGNMLIAQGYSVTHFAFSSRMGSGNAVLYGHDDIEGSIFAHLADLRPGDEVHVSTPDGARIYRVIERRIVSATAIEILNPTSDVRLTIFTCWPTWVDTQRVVITARPVSS